LGCSPIKAVRELGLERRTLRPQEVIPGCSLAHIGETLNELPNVLVQGNTEGRPTHVNVSTASYVAGFLDGDGSIHFQLVKQKEYRFGFYIRSSVSFSQSTSARWGLEQIQTIVGGGGYVRDRRTGMSDLVITSRPAVLRVLQAVQPYVIFKKTHVGRALEILPRLDRVRDPEVFLHLARQVDAFATLNYSKTKRISAVDVERHLRSMGVLCPRNDFFASNSEEMAF
jgi:LAGLIDADG endonuclease